MIPLRDAATTVALGRIEGLVRPPDQVERAFRLVRLGLVGHRADAEAESHRSVQK